MHPYEVGAAIPSYYRSRFGCRPHAPARKTLSRPQLLRAAERLCETMNELVTDTAKPPDEEVNEAGGFAFDPNVGIVRGVEPLTGPTREA